MKRVLLLPSLFGISRSEHIRATWLRGLGYSVNIIDIYRGQEVQRPNLIGFMLRHGGPKEAAIDGLALSLRESAVFDSIQFAMRGDTTPALLVGVSIGGCFALRFAQEFPLLTAGVVAVSPRLTYPENRPAYVVEPDLAKVSCSLFLAYGQNSEEAVAAEKLAKEPARPNLKYKTYPGGHGFCNRFSQAWLPSPFWNADGARLFQRDLSTWLAMHY